MSRPTPEDLVNAVIAADVFRRKSQGLEPLKSHARRPFHWAPFFNLLGWLWGMLTRMLPWRWSKGYVQWVVRTMAGHPQENNPRLPERIQETIRLSKEIQARSGHWPALLVVMSHPDTEGPLQWLRFELMSQGLQVADAFVEARRPGRCFYRHPRCLLAIDPFALDTVSPAVGNFYAAWIHQVNLAYDRQPSAQSWLQRNLFLRQTSYAYIGWKLLRLLKSHVPVLMALGGGLPYNARLLYGVREFVHHLKIPRWAVPKRAAQIELMEILIDGKLTASHKPQILEALARWGLPRESAAAEFEKLDEEFRLPVPYRTRLLRILQRKFEKCGKELIILPITHTPSPPHVQVLSPMVLPGKFSELEVFGKKLANIFAGSVSKG